MQSMAAGSACAPLAATLGGLVGSVAPVSLHSMHLTPCTAAQAHASYATETGIEGFLGAALLSRAAPGRHDPRQRRPYRIPHRPVAPCLGQPPPSTSPTPSRQHRTGANAGEVPHWIRGRPGRRTTRPASALEPAARRRGRCIHPKRVRGSSGLPSRRQAGWSMLCGADASLRMFRARPMHSACFPVAATTITVAAAGFLLSEVSRVWPEA